MFKKIWKMYGKSIIGSLTVILLVASLIYAASIVGKFSFIPSTTGYAVIPEFSVVAIIASFVILLVLFIILYRKNR